MKLVILDAPSMNTSCLFTIAVGLHYPLAKYLAMNVLILRVEND